MGAILTGFEGVEDSEAGLESVLRALDDANCRLPPGTITQTGFKVDQISRQGMIDWLRMLAGERLARELAADRYVGMSNEDILAHLNENRLYLALAGLPHAPKELVLEDVVAVLE